MYTHTCTHTRVKDTRSHESRPILSLDDHDWGSGGGGEKEDYYYVINPC